MATCGCNSGSDDAADVITIYRGDSIEMAVQVKRADPRTGAVLPYNLTSAKVWITIKRDSGDLDTVAIAQVSTTSSSPVGGTVTIASPPESGWVDIVVPSAATVSLPAVEQWLVYDIQVRDQSAIIKTVARGRIRVLPDVTMAVA